MNIAGSGVIPAGEFEEKVSISGSGRINGNLRCTAFSVAGSASGTGDLHCAEILSVAGSMHLDGSVTAQTVRVSGSLRLDGACTAQEDVRVAGAAHFGGKVKCTKLHSSGALHLQQGADAEEICVKHTVQSGGLLNAEKVALHLRGGKSRVACIGGSEISVTNEGQKRTLRNLFCFGDRGEGWLQVSESIEGESIALENTETPLVVGDTVVIGRGCEIGAVQYRDTLTVHPEATVGKTEKL